MTDKIIVNTWMDQEVKKEIVESAITAVINSFWKTQSTYLVTILRNQDIDNSTNWSKE